MANHPTPEREGRKGKAPPDKPPPTMFRLSHSRTRGQGFTGAIETQKICANTTLAFSCLIWESQPALGRGQHKGPDAGCQGTPLGGSWVLISRVISRVTRVITLLQGLITRLFSTHEPPSMNPLKPPRVLLGTPAQADKPNLKIQHQGRRV